MSVINISIPKRCCQQLTLILIGVMLLSTPTVAKETKTYVMGVFPHLPPREIEKIFAPMAADIGKVIKQKVILRSSTTYEKFMENLDKEIFDIAFVQPFDYIRIADRFNYQPLATRKNKLSAIIVTKPDSPLNHVQDLKGNKVAMPPKVAAVSYLLKGFFRENKIEPQVDVTITHHRSHVSCMQQVIIGIADACGTAMPALRFFQSKMNVKLKIIANSRKIPHTLFTIHPRINEKERKMIQDRIISWGKTRSGKEILARGRLKPFIPIKDSDYDIVRHLSK